MARGMGPISSYESVLSHVRQCRGSKKFFRLRRAFVRASIIFSYKITAPSVFFSHLHRCPRHSIPAFCYTLDLYQANNKENSSS
jgi:hypothetical protein